MADEEKPAVDDQSTEAVEPPKSEAEEIVEVADAGAPAKSDAQEAIEAIAKNVQERASEIEDVLADVSSPTALPKSTASMPSEPASAATSVDVAEEDEPNLQISVGGEKVRISTAHPMIEEIAEQLHKSRQFTQYAVGSLCIALLAAVLFYVLMAAQLSSKVKEIDGMLGAVAKRTLQMTKGIETFSILGRQLDKTLANQSMQQEMLAANEIAVVNLNEQLDLLSEVVTTNANETMAQTQQVLLAELNALQDENAAVKTNLDRLAKILEAQKTEVSALRGVRRELSTVRASMQQVETTVGDLYIIERARLAKQVLSPKADVVGE
jgi:hypothetical protein